MNRNPQQKQKHPLSMRARGSNVRSPSLRKLGKDGPTWTPSEERQRDRLMKQFSRQVKGYGLAISEEYRAGYDGIDWGDNE